MWIKILFGSIILQEFGLQFLHQRSQTARFLQHWFHELLELLFGLALVKSKHRMMRVNVKLQICRYQFTNINTNTQSGPAQTSIPLQALCPQCVASPKHPASGQHLGPETTFQRRTEGHLRPGWTKESNNWCQKVSENNIYYDNTTLFQPWLSSHGFPRMQVSPVCDLLLWWSPRTLPIRHTCCAFGVALAINFDQWLFWTMGHVPYESQWHWKELCK